MQSRAEQKIFPGYLSFDDLWILGIVHNIFKDFVSYQATFPTFKWPFQDLCIDRPELVVSWEIHSHA